jgi:protein gp37
MSEHYWNAPIRWNRKHEKAGTFGKVFSASMADVMDDEAPAGQRERLWKLIDDTPRLIWQLLTKRPQRYERYLPARFKHRNVWLGTTAEDQENYDLRLPHLHNAIYLSGLPVAWVSYEPALGPLSLITSLRWVPDWVIYGGESGANRRKDSEGWLRQLHHEINVLKLPTKLFVKQMSARTPAEGKALIPDDMLIQEFPE